MERTVGYVDNGGVQIAYEVVGHGERDLVLVYEWGSSLDVRDKAGWFSGTQADLSEFGRIIRFDLRGSGLSERVDGLPPLEEWADDVRAVMEEVGSSSATLLGWGHAAQLSMLFAAMYPERVEALIIVNGFARLSRDTNYPYGYPPKARAQLQAEIRRTWGTGLVLGFTSPTLATSAESLEDLARAERAAATPYRAARVQASMFGVDVRDLLSSISTATLIIHSRNNPWISPDHGRYLADHIANSRYVEIESNDHAIYQPTDRAQWVPVIREFLDNPRLSAPSTRSLMTVAFTDIVDSTRTAAALGDAKWRLLLEKHENLTRRSVERAGGRVVKFTGDGMMATFDGPARAIDGLRELGRRLSEVGIPIRSGVHTGEVEILGDDIGGLGVHIATRVSAKASAGEIFTSSTVRDLVAGSGLEFTDQGEHELKGVPGTWRLLSVINPDSP